MGEPHTLYCPSHDVEWLDGSTTIHDRCIGTIDVTWEVAHGGMDWKSDDAPPS